MNRLKFKMTIGLCLTVLSGMCSNVLAQTVVTLSSIGDTYTQQGTPTTNYGTQTTTLVRIDTANSLTRGAYYEFDLSSLPAGTIASAKLRLFGSHDTGGTGVTINAFGGTATTAWSETALVYNNALTLSATDFSGTPIASVAVAPPPSTTYEWDVTTYISGRRSAGVNLATFGLGAAAANTYRATFNSKEAASNKPQLVVTVNAPGTYNLSSIGDTYTQQGTPTTNYGTQTTTLVRIDTANSLTRGAYYEFDLSSLPVGTITSAKLKLFGSHDTGGTGVTINAFGGTATTAWSETALVYNNALTLSATDFSGTPIASVAVAPPPSTTYEWDVTSYVSARRSAGSNLATFGLGAAAANTYRATFNSKEATSNKPVLSVTVGGAPPPPPSWTPTCPSGYVPTPGENINFPTPSGNRSFSLNLPSSTSTPRPVWVPLTGSVESTTENLDARGGNRLLTNYGYIVIGPVRKCAGSGAGSVSAAGTSVNGGTCNQAGTGGWTWNPWNEGRTFDAAGDPWKTDEGPDSQFLESVVKCVATQYPVDQTRVFIGGISSGGTMTNRALAFNSDFWAGGMPISGEWYVTQDNGTAYTGSDEFLARRAAVAADPYRIYQGRVGPYPLKSTLADTTSLSPMIVITVWGGTDDIWYCGTTLCADYRPTTQVASNYFSSFSNVLHIACSSTHGHQWPTVNRDAFNQWALATLSSHPKGTPKASFGNKLITNPPPLGYSCVLGPFADHYTGAPPPSAGSMNWGMFGHDYNNSRSSPDTTISASNASSLHVLSRVTGGGITSTPTIVDDVAYVSDFRGHVKAIRITDNVTLWDVMPSTSITMLSPSPYVTGDTVYVGGDLGWVFALNRATGAVRWSRQIETTPNARVSSSPIVVGNILIVGSGSYQVFVPATPMFRGKVAFLDASTGVPLSYITDVCPTGTCGGGISVWSTAAIDSQTRTGYIGAGQAYAAPAGPYSDALIAFNLDTGAIRWSYQFTPNDVYTINTGTLDHDVGAAPNLFTAVVGGVTRQLVGVGDKGGRYAAFDRATGAQVWMTTIGNASPIGGMMHSAAYDNGGIFVVNNSATVGSSRNDPVPSSGVARRLNAATGAIEWSLDLPAGGFGGVSIANGLMYFTTWDGVLRVLNASTGAVVKTVQIGPAVGAYVPAPTDGFPNGSASGPIVYNGKVYVGYGWTWVLNIDGGLAAIGL